MIDRAEGFYFGRFQPPLLKHAEIAAKISQNYSGIYLTVGLANNLFGLTRENFLTGAESQQFFEETLKHMGVADIETALVDIHSDRSFVDSLSLFFDSRPSNCNRIIFSGSGSTIKACEELSENYGLSIIKLADDDETGPRARHVRNGLIVEETQSWRDLVAPSVYDFLKDPQFSARIRELTNGAKRPWTTDQLVK